MSDLDRILGLYAELNPVPDVDALVTNEASSSTKHEGGRLHMSDTTVQTIRAEQQAAPSPPPRSRWLWVAAVVVAVVTIAMMVLPGSNDPEVIATVPAEVEVAEEVAIFQTAIAAYNAGDVDGFLASFSDDATLFGQSRAADPAGVRDLQAFFMAFDQDFDLICSSDGPAVTCWGTMVDALGRAVNRRPEPVEVEATVEGGLVTSMGWTGYNAFQLVRAIAIWTATYQPTFWGERFVECSSETNCFTFDNVSFLANEASGEALVEVSPAYAEITQTRTGDHWAGDGPEGDL